MKEKLNAIDRAGDHVRQQINDTFRNKKPYWELEKENVQLEKKLRALEGQAPWTDIKDKSEVIGKLTKAKEIIGNLFEIIKRPYRFTAPRKIQMVKEAEQFLTSDVEIQCGSVICSY